MNSSELISDEKSKKNQLIEWCKSDILPKIEIYFGTIWDKVTLDISVPKDSYYLSSVYFLDIKIDKDNKHVHAVIKKPRENKQLAEFFNTDKLFSNEILFYKKIVDDSERFPRCFYASDDNENVDNTVIVMENIESIGYKICPSVYDIPFEFVISGVQEIGRFHGMSYREKSRDSKNFFNIVSEIKEIKYAPKSFCSKFFNLIAKRPVKWLRKINYDEKFCDKIEYYMNNAFENFILNLIKPVEPLAVICHGDFTRNNILFRRNNGVLDSMLIDFAMMRYASPSIDLSTFLFYSVSKNDRTKRFNEIFTAYHEALLQYLNDEKIKILDCYTYDKFLCDYKCKVMFGYMIAICYLPILYRLCRLSDGLIASNCDPEETYRISKIGDAGGDELSKQFADMLIEVRELGGLDHLQDLE